jgi:hypothetical protein
MAQLKVIAQLPMGLYDEVATGTASSIEEVFERYGYDTVFAGECKSDKRFQVLVNERRKELEKTGQLHANRAAAVSDMALSELTRRLEDAPTPVVLSIYQATAKIGRLEPQNNVAAVAGPGFSISIHLDGKPTEKVVEAQVIEHDDLGEPPAYLSNLNRELEYKE